MLFFKKKKEPKPEKSIHNLRTANVLVDTFDFIKKITYLFELGIQLVYISYLVFKLILRTGWLVGNIVLLSLSVIYLIYHTIATHRTFETKEEKKAAKKKHKIIKRIFRILKRLTNFAIVVYATYQLSISKSNSIVDILFLIFMIVGFIASIVCDLIIYIIDARIQLIKDAIAVDVVDFKENHKYLGKAFDHWETTRDLQVDEQQRSRVEKMVNRVKERHPHFFKKKNKKGEKDIDHTELM